MRKFTLLMLTFVCTMVAWAEVPALKVSTEGNITYYTIKNYRSGKFAMWTGDGSQLAQNAALTDACYWYLLANGDDGYTLCNKATDNKYAGHSSFTADGAKTYILENPHKAGYFCVSLSANLSSNCWDDQSSSTKIGYYAPKADDSDGTSWIFTEASGNVDKDNLKVLLDVAKVSVGTNPGCYPQAAVAAAQTVFDSENGDYAAAKTALESAFILPVSGKYYRITSAYSEFENKQGVTKSVYVDGNNLKWRTTDRADMSSIWEIYHDGSKFVFKNYSTKTYISTYADNLFSLGDEANANTGFTWYAGGICNINIDGGNFHADGHTSGAGQNGTIIKYGSGNSGASAWYIVEVEDPAYEAAHAALANRIDELKIGKQLGNNLGQYTLSGMGQTEYEAAVAAAKAVLNNSSSTTADFTGALETLNTVTLTLNGLQVGKYYRIENTAMDNYYLGIDGYTLKMKHNEVSDEVTYDNNPGIIWKYEQDGDNFYMKNVYSGLYPQNIPSGQDKTATIGTGKEKAFTYALHEDLTETVATKWNIFFGGTQVNCEGNAGNEGNVNHWFGDNAHYYIYEVEAPTDDFAEMCVNWHEKNSEVLPKIKITEGAKITSPSEFREPDVVNAAIDVVNASSDFNFSAQDATMEKIHSAFEKLSTFNGEESTEHGIVLAYINAIRNNGALLSVDYITPAAEYATIILPVNWSLPAGWRRFACSASEGNVLTLENKDNEGTNKNRPYIVQLGEEQRGAKYQFIGYSKAAATTNQTVGWLTGVLKEGSKVSAGSYILSTYNGKQGFFKVADGTDYSAAMNKCYLTVSAEAPSRYAALFFDGDTETGIDNVLDSEKEQGNGLIYNMAGQRLNGLQKGLNIVNGKIILN